MGKMVFCMGIEIGQDKTDKQADRQNSSQVDSGNGIKCLNDDIKQIHQATSYNVSVPKQMKSRYSTSNLAIERLSYYCSSLTLARN